MNAADHFSVVIPTLSGAKGSNLLLPSAIDHRLSTIYA
jgi:hypothetical protein